MGLWFGLIITVISWILVLLTFPLSMCFCLKVIKEYERVVIFRLGRLMRGGARGPGEFVVPSISLVSGIPSSRINGLAAAILPTFHVLSP